MAVLFAYGGDIELPSGSANVTPDGASWRWNNGAGSSAAAKDTTVRTGVTATGRSTLLTSGGGTNVQSSILLNNLGGTTGTDYWYHAWFRIPSGNLPTAETTIFRQRTAAGNNGIQLSLDNLGRLKLYSGGASSEFSGTLHGTTPSNTVVVDTWYKLIVHFKRVAAGSDVLEIKLNGTTIASLTTADILSVSDPDLSLGWVTATAAVSKLMYVDDIVILDNSGSTFNAEPGDLHANWLLPSSDNARTGTVPWTGGAGGTTSLFDAVNNVPPVGQPTTSDTNTSQIRHNGSGSGVYDANCPAYSTLGVTAPADVASLVLAASTGEEVTTGDKLVRLEGVSGPVIASTADLNVAASVAVGVHPSGWVYIYGTRVATQPAAASTTPVIRINRSELASRAAACEFLGLQVVWQRPGLTTSARTAAQTAAISTPGLTRTASQSAAISTPGRVRQATQTAAISVSFARSAAQSAAIKVTSLRSAAQSVAISVAGLLRSAAQSAAISVQGNQRTAAQSAAIRVTSARTAVQSAAIQTIQLTRQAAQSATILVTSARSAAQSAAILVQGSRQAAQSAAISTPGAVRTAPQTASISQPGPGTIQLFAPQSAAVSTPSLQRTAAQSAAILVLGVRAAGQSAAISTAGLQRTADQSVAISDLGLSRQAPQSAAITYVLARLAEQTAAIATLRLTREAPQSASISVEGPATPTYDQAMQAPSRPGTLSTAGDPSLSGRVAGVFKAPSSGVGQSRGTRTLKTRG